MKTAELIAEAISLPVEERVMVIDPLLRSLNTPDPALDQTWMPVAQRRLAELRAGKVEGISGDEIFRKVSGRGS